MSDSHESLKQELLELYFDCHPEPEPLRQRLAADPDLQRMYAEIEAVGGVLQEAAREAAPDLDLQTQRIHKPRWTGIRPGRWIAAAAAAVLLVLGGNWAWAAWGLSKVRSESLRLLVSAPPSLPDGSPLRFAVETKNFDRENLIAQVDWRIYDESNELLAESTSLCTGELDVQVPGNLQKPRRLEIVATVPATGAQQRVVHSLQPAQAAPLVHLSSDKPAYRPGETVRLRAACLDRVTLEGMELGALYCRITDGKDSEVQKTGLAVSKGTAAHLWQVPTHAMGGIYHFEIRDRKNDITLERLPFLVRNFQAPKLRKKVDLDRETYAPGSQGKAVVELQRLEQQDRPAAGAKVYASLIVDGEETWKQEGEADAEGLCRFDFAVPDRVEKGSARFVARVVDGGQTETILEPFVIPTDKIEALFSPEGGVLVDGVEGRVYLQLEDALGRPLSGAGAIVDGAGKEICKVRTEHLGRARFALTPKAGVTYRLQLQEPLQKSFELPAVQKYGVALRLLDEVVAPGADVRLRVQAKRPGPFLAAVFCRGVVVGQRSLRPSLGEAVDLRIPVGAKASGVLRVTVFDRFTRPVAERLIQRRAKQQIKVELTPKLAKGAPGETQTIAVKTTDEAGKPVAAVVGLSVYDKAVAALVEHERNGIADQQQLWADVERPDDKADELQGRGAKVAQRVDLLLGSLGWRRFAWTGKQTEAELVEAGGDWAKSLRHREGLAAVPRVIDTRMGSAAALVQAWDSKRRAMDVLEQGSAWVLGALLFAVLVWLSGRLMPRQPALLRGGFVGGWSLASALVAFIAFGPKIGCAGGASGFEDSLIANAPPTAAPVLREELSALNSFNFPAGGGVGIAGGGNGGVVAFDSELEDASRAQFRVARFADSDEEGEGPVIFSGESVLAFQPPAVVFGALSFSETGDALRLLHDGYLAQTRGDETLNGLFFNDGADGDIRGRTENLFPLFLGVNTRGLASGGGGAFVATDVTTTFSTQVGLTVTGGLNAPIRLPLNQAFWVRGQPSVALADPAPSDFIVAGRSTLGRFYKQRFAYLQQLAANLGQLHFRFAHPGGGGARAHFAETLFWQPLLITDEKGEASISFDLSDTLGTFTIAANAHGAGRVGQGEAEFSCALPFSLSMKAPLHLTEGDEVQIPVAFLADDKRAELAELQVQSKGTQELVDAAPRKVKLDQGRGRALIGVKATRAAGRGSTAHLMLQASIGKAKDSMRRSYQVLPRGFPHSLDQAGWLEDEVKLHFDMPDGLSLRTAVLELRFALTPLANLQQGLGGMLRTPSGCFEQVSSSNYPNIMALSLMDDGGDSIPALQERAEDLLRKGYAKLAGYEVAGGGFDWWGKAPAHVALSAYGLMQFVDLQRVLPIVDAQLLERTKSFLLSKRDSEGGFVTGQGKYGHFMGGTDDTRSSYVTMALLYAGVPAGELQAEVARLARRAETCEDPYETAICAVGLGLAKHEAAAAARARLLKLRQADGSLQGQQSITASGKPDRAVEATSLAMLAWMDGDKNPATEAAVLEGLHFLAGKRRGGGSYGATQATVWALKAFYAFARSNTSVLQPDVLSVHINGKQAHSQQLRGSERRGIELLDLATHLQPGRNEVRIKLEKGANRFPYLAHLGFRAEMPHNDKDAPLRLSTSLTAQQLDEGAVTTAQILLRNITKDPVANPLVLVGIPAGLEVDTKVLEDLKKAETIAAWELAERHLVLYLRGLRATEEREILVELTGRLPGTTSGQASVCYPYYSPDQKHWAKPLRAKVR